MTTPAPCYRKLSEFVNCVFRMALPTSETRQSVARDPRRFV